MPTPKPTLPNEIMDACAEGLVATPSRLSNVVYLTLLGVLVTALSSLPFIETTVSTTSPGILRPVVEVTKVKAPGTGKVLEVRVPENSQVGEGEVLIVIESVGLREKLGTLQRRIVENGTLIDDLRRLVSGAEAIHSPLYRQSWFTHRQRVVEANTIITKATIDYERNKKLFEREVIAKTEEEDYRFELEKALNNLSLLEQGQLGQWQSELRSLLKESNNLESELLFLQNEEENLVVRSPVNGTLQNMQGLYPGSFVFANQDLGAISPDTTLLAEVYLSPGDIGLLRTGMEVRFRIDAFHYHQWGLLNGHVRDISNDFQLVRDKPVFQVRCTLDKEYLELKNGHRGQLRKGMTLQARFLVAERSLWQLLYDHVDDWINPNEVAASTGE